MTQASRTQLTVLMNILLWGIVSIFVLFIEETWQQKREAKAAELERQKDFIQAENHLNVITSFISRIANEYNGTCSRNLILDMRKGLFGIPGSIEFAIVHTEGGQGVISCNSWGEKGSVKVSKPDAHSDFLMVGPHTMNALAMPVYAIKKTTDDIEYHILIKKSSVDLFFLNHPSIVFSIESGVVGEKYKKSNVISNLSYLMPALVSSKIHINPYIIPILLIWFFLVYFFITPKLVRRIDKLLLKYKIGSHYYYNEYQPIFDTRDGSVFSIEVFLRSEDDDNARDTIEKMKRLDLSIDHTIFQISQIERSFSTTFLEQHDFQVNISSRHLESAFFIDHILNLKGLTCSSLILEVTEDENLMLHKQTIKKHMNILKEKGCRFAIDDFGMEYSGLSYISEFDFDIVKTDKIFMSKTNQNTAILKSIIAFCNELNIDCIAEGIETQDNNEQTNHIGIYLHQGWYHGRPINKKKIMAFTAQN